MPQPTHLCRTCSGLPQVVSIYITQFQCDMQTVPDTAELLHKLTFQNDALGLTLTMWILEQPWLHLTHIHVQLASFPGYL